jgi:TPR repeat protein
MVAIEAEAQRGSSKGQFLLGMMYKKGLHMPLNLEGAEKWLLKAYQQFEPHCCLELHELTDSQNEKRRYLEVGKELEEVRCWLAAGWYFFQGVNGFPLDLQEACDIVEELCSRKYPKAFLLRGRICSVEKSEYFSPQEVLSSYRQGAELGDWECKVALAVELRRQKKHPQAIEQASALLKREGIPVEDRLTLSLTLAKSYAKLQEYS